MAEETPAMPEPDRNPHVSDDRFTQRCGDRIAWRGIAALLVSMLVSLSLLAVLVARLWMIGP